MPVGGNGPNVGTCNNETHTCDIRAWCPTEYENETITYVCAALYVYCVELLFFCWCLLCRHSAPLINASNFTVLIKNSIRYPALLPNDRKSVETLHTCVCSSPPTSSIPTFQRFTLPCVCGSPQVHVSACTCIIIAMTVLAKMHKHCMGNYMYCIYIHMSQFSRLGILVSSSPSLTMYMCMYKCTCMFVALCVLFVWVSFLSFRKLVCAIHMYFHAHV